MSEPVTYDDFQQYQTRKKTIENTEDLIEQTYYAVYSPRVDYTGTTVSISKKDPTTRALEKIEMLRERNAALIHRNQLVEDAINSMEDPFLQQICNYRYLLGYSWRETTARVYGRLDGAPNTAREFCRRHLKALGID